MQTQKMARSAWTLRWAQDKRGRGPGETDVVSTYPDLGTDSGLSPRDHAVLESAYQKNSKPDKEERLDLVKQVDLGEKEVQV